MVGRSLAAIFRIAFALAALKCLADLARNGHAALALAAVVLPITIAIVVRARGSATGIAPVAGPSSAKGAAIFRRLQKPDQIRVASLAASGNAIGAIKALHALTNTDLRAAKDVVDELAAPKDRQAV
jgi:ribosomal protein L7/L12